MYLSTSASRATRHTYFKTCRGDRLRFQRVYAISTGRVSSRTVRYNDDRGGREAAYTGAVCVINGSPAHAAYVCRAPCTLEWQSIGGECTRRNVVCTMSVRFCRCADVRWRNLQIVSGTCCAVCARAALGNGKNPAGESQRCEQVCQRHIPRCVPVCIRKGILSDAAGVTADRALMRLNSAAAAVVPFVPPLLIGTVPLSLALPW